MREPTGTADQLPIVFGRLVEADGATPPAFRGPVPLPVCLMWGIESSEARRSDLEVFSGFASSRRRAIALAVSSILSSGRWLGGLRFEMAGVS
jgi:hypothetical protein